MTLAAAFHVFDMLVLSFTSHARLKLASEPADYDLILRRTIREVKFYSETLLAILFFAESPGLLSQTLACLMFTLITYIALEAMTGDSLHKQLDEIPCGRIVLACMTKLPALTVLWSLAALALSQWDSLATKIVLCIVACVLLLGLAASLRVFALLKNAWLVVSKSAGCVIERGRKRKSSDASVVSKEGSDADGKSDGGESVDGVLTLSGDECV